MTFSFIFFLSVVAMTMTMTDMAFGYKNIYFKLSPKFSGGKYCQFPPPARFQMIQRELPFKFAPIIINSAISMFSFLLSDILAQLLVMNVR